MSGDGIGGQRSAALLWNMRQAHVEFVCNLAHGEMGETAHADRTIVDCPFLFLRRATARATMRIRSPRRECLFCARSRERIFTIDLDGAGLDAWNKLAPELNSIVERIEAADEKGGRTEPVIFEDRFGHLLGGAHQT